VALRFMEEGASVRHSHPRFDRRRAFSLSPNSCWLSAVGPRSLVSGFDKIMTNGVLVPKPDAPGTGVARVSRPRVLTAKLGLSVDKFQRRRYRSAGRILPSYTPGYLARDNIISISYASRAPDQGLGACPCPWPRNWPASSNGPISCIGTCLVTRDLTITLNWNHLAPVGAGPSASTGAWDSVWFQEDYCEGPGQALIVNPRGEVKAMLRLRFGPGPAHHRQHLSAQCPRRSFAGHAGTPYVGKVFREGLELHPR